MMNERFLVQVYIYESELQCMPKFIGMVLFVDFCVLDFKTIFVRTISRHIMA